jgi:hypothetical protein
MEELDFRKQRSEKFTANHELTDDQLEQLIENKFNRAMLYYNALQKREDLLVEQD